MPTLRWPHIVAGSACMAGFILLAIGLLAYSPEPYSDSEIDAGISRSLENCGHGLFAVVPHDAVCTSFDSISLEVRPCWPDCPAYTMTISADGKAELVVLAPEQERGEYEATLSKRDFARLANLLAAMQLDRLGGLSPPPPDVGDQIVSAGCNGVDTTVANYGPRVDDISAFSRCLAQVKSSVHWSRQ